MYPREYFDTYWRGDLKNEVFVIMSFAPEFQPAWEDAIKPAIEVDTGRIKGDEELKGTGVFLSSNNDSRPL